MLSVPGAAVGRRKQAIARVRITPGSGVITVNGRSFEDYFPNKLHQQLVKDPFTVLVDCQDHVVETARAWVDLVVLEAFAAKAEGVPVLERLCSLHALHRIEAERGYYQEHGRLTAQRAKAMIAAVNELCAAIRPHARTLVDALGVPEAALAAPIAGT